MQNSSRINHRFDDLVVLYIGWDKLLVQRTCNECTFNADFDKAGEIIPVKITATMCNPNAIDVFAYSIIDSSLVW